MSEARQLLAMALDRLAGGRLATQLVPLAVALATDPAQLPTALASLGVALPDPWPAGGDEEEGGMAARGQPGAPLAAVDRGRVGLRPLRRFVPGELVALPAAPAAGGGALVYARVLEVGPAGDGDVLAGDGGDEGLSRLRLLVSEPDPDAGPPARRPETRMVLSSDVLAFFPTATHHHAAPQDPAAARGAHRGAAAVGASGEREAGPPAAVSAEESARVAADLLRQLGLPATLEQEKLAASALDLKSRLRVAERQLEAFRGRVVRADTALERLQELCTCPITQEVMRDPVVASDGHVYERAAIQRCIGGADPISPLTRQRLSTTLMASHAHKTLCRLYAEAAAAT